jgi:ABC-type dipeptide/oligopeptide/nickel transport system permease subunit/outer membrane protein assembly factor BamB
VIVIVYLALAGPQIAPSDPLQENFIVIREDRALLKPPFAPGQEPRFPLGADEFGRDILSRLLWAVRPTLTLVLVVAALRLSLGTLVGLVSGWAPGQVGRATDALIAAVVSAPPLFVALAVVAATGQRLGVWAFILGLSVTGWAEVARIVREQTRLIQGQRYVESARALGAADLQILTRHVLPQIVPVLWMLLVLESSSALLTTAALGFLGYFINAVWIPLGDYTGIRASGYPDLGQMLTFSGASHQPWAALMAGSLVVLIVLGFNLLGEGLRLELSPERRRRGSGLSHRLEHMGGWFEDRVFLLLAEWQRTATLSGAALGLIALILGGGWWLWAQTAAAAPGGNTIDVPGGHAWASARHDAQGTAWIADEGPATGEVAWVFTDTNGFAGGPVIAADGTLYLASHGNTLYALDAQGRLRWQAAIPFAASGTPALNSRGDILVAGHQGELADFGAADGKLWWQLPASQGQALADPIVGLDDTLYYATDAELFAVTADGLLRWRVGLPTYSYSNPVLRLSGDGRYLFFQNVIVSTSRGEIAFSVRNSIEFFFSGADGKTYLRTQAGVDEWTLTDGKATVKERTRLDTRALALSFRFASDSGLTPSGRWWAVYASGFDHPTIIWTDPTGEVPEVIATPYRTAQVMGFDANNVTYICGLQIGGRELAPDCRAARTNGEMIWQVPLAPEAGMALGGALTAGRLYVATSAGHLYAFGK